MPLITMPIITIAIVIIFVCLCPCPGGGPATVGAPVQALSGSSSSAHWLCPRGSYLAFEDIRELGIEQILREPKDG